VIIALCQQNTITGNVPRNTQGIIEFLREAAKREARVAIFPELAITGYPPRDLLEYAWFNRAASASLTDIQAACRETGVAAIVGTVHTNIFGGKKDLLNAAAWVSPEGEVRFAFKKLLPTYDVFDEHRYFQPCPADAPPLIVEIGAGIRAGISICEDIWNDNEFWKDQRLYEFDPIESLVRGGANLIVNISASPFVLGKPLHRLEMLRHTARRWGVPVLLVNQVGGCDQVIFDGGSCVVMPDGRLAACAGWFSEAMVCWDSESGAVEGCGAAQVERVGNEVTAIHDALILGMRDYLAKTGFKQVLAGNSGGIDSAFVLTLATAGLGPENVISVSMPGPFTSVETRRDSALLAQRLGIRHVEVPIGGPFDVFQNLLMSAQGPVLPALFCGTADNVSRLANENLQARLRGNILMWISNAFRTPPTLLLSTGNKSELAVGYCTLYGDMAGGLAVISDVPKMMVYRLARFLNARMGNPIPQSVLDREPSAELAPNQKDTDSLPPYPVLDEIIRLYVEERLGAEDIAAVGVAEPALIQRVIGMIDRAEYKRQQAAVGLKVTSKAFGFGRRMPIARG
jgi:NAD+ synthase (glutamine-hydrolysing)